MDFEPLWSAKLGYPELAVKAFDEWVIGGFAPLRIIGQDVALAGPEVEIARDELTAKVGAELFRQSNRLCRP